MQRVLSIDAVLHGPPGYFDIRWAKDGAASYRMLWVKLPNEGGELHGLPLRPAATSDQRASWEWDGNPEHPTLSPSVLSWRNNAQGQRVESWHGFIQNGVAKSC